MSRGRGSARGLSSFLDLMDETGNRAAPAGEAEGTAEGGHDGSVQECATAISQMRAGAGSIDETGDSKMSSSLPPGLCEKKKDDDGRSVTSSMSAGAGTDRAPVGSPQEVVTNYFLMSKQAKFTLYGYRVDFLPEEDNTRRKRRLMDQHKDKLGNFMFDGHTLYSAVKFEPQTLNSQDGTDQFEIRMRKVSDIEPDNSVYEQFYNIVMRNLLEKMGMEQVGRHYYDRLKAVEMPQDRLTLWPGLITAIRRHEAGMMLCVEVTHKVLRNETAYDVMRDIGKDADRNPGNRSEEQIAKMVEDRCRTSLMESIVITHYNRRTYRVDEIDFQQSPLSEFTKDDGTTMTLKEYYKTRWNVNIQHDDQPLLVSYPRKKDKNKGITDKIFLIPELCFMTGLTDAMRKNFQLMKRLSVHLHMNPSDRKQRLDDFIAQFRTAEIKRELDRWNLEFSSEFVKAGARVLPRESVEMGVDDGKSRQGKWFVPDDSQDWTIHFRNAGLLEPQRVSKWIIFVPSDQQRAVQDFVKTLQSVGKKLGIEIANQLAVIPYEAKGRFERDEFMRRVKNYMTDLDLIFYILPNNQLPRYAAVKRACTIELKTVSQCFQSKHLGSGGKLISVCQKMLIQVHAKLRGEPWAVKIPLSKIMILGFDTYHCPDRKGESVGALVATTNKNCTKYFSLASFHKDKKELTFNMAQDVIKSLSAYKKANDGALPTRIVLFRDGVGEGQVDYVREQEVEQIRNGIQTFYRDNGVEDPVKLAVVIVTKKINSRLLIQRGNRWISPVPGTVLDNTVTLPERYEFFLVSQTVRQGTVSPTNYHVVYDESGLPSDRLQQLAYKLCHLYFNWSGTVAVPAPCQYAHKLAYITGMALADEVPEELASNLWYL